MNRQEVYKEMEEVMGVVPGFFKACSDSTLEMEWKLFKRVQMEPGALPNKTRELIGVAIAAVNRCRFCAYFHTRMAKLNGATDAEIEDALHFAKSAAGWSSYINGLQTDFEIFKSEVDKACEHVQRMMK